MYLNPPLYQKLIRPRFAIDKYIKRPVKKKFNLDNSRVLDFGCGTGSNSFIFNSKDYLGVDVDEKKVDFAIKSYPKYSFKVITDNLLPANNNSFDYICIFATIHHIPDSIFQGCIEEFKRVLDHNGKIVMIEPVFSEDHKFKNWFMRTLDHGRHIRSEKGYMGLFEKDFTVTVHKRFRKFFFYNELFFSASKR